MKNWQQRFRYSINCRDKSYCSAKWLQQGRRIIFSHISRPHSSDRYRFQAEWRQRGLLARILLSKKIPPHLKVEGRLASYFLPIEKRKRKQKKTCRKITSATQSSFMSLPDDTKTFAEHMQTFSSIIKSRQIERLTISP